MRDSNYHKAQLQETKQYLTKEDLTPCPNIVKKIRTFTAPFAEGYISFSKRKNVDRLAQYVEYRIRNTKVVG